MQTWQASTWKGAQSHWSVKKQKSKPWWDIISHLLQRPRTKPQEIIRVAEDVERGEHLCTIGEDCKLVQPLWKTLWRLLKKLKIGPLYDPAIPLLGIYPTETKSSPWESICTLMLTATLFPTHEDNLCSSTDERIKKCGLHTHTHTQTYTHTWCALEYYLAIKKKGIRGNSRVVQCLGFSPFTPGAWLQLLAGELRSCQPCGMAKRKKKKEILSFVTTGIYLWGHYAEIKHTKKDKYWTISLVCEIFLKYWTREGGRQLHLLTECKLM